MIGHARGFTLLEAIVALVLLAGTGMALFAWLNTNLLSLQRVEASRQRDAVMRGALEYATTLNPMLQPTGERQLGAYTLNWRSEPIFPPRDGVGRVGTQGYYRVGFYRVELEIRQDEELVARFEIKQPGYEQVRYPSEDLL